MLVSIIAKSTCWLILIKIFGRLSFNICIILFFLRDFLGRICFVGIGIFIFLGLLQVIYFSFVNFKTILICVTHPSLKIRIFFILRFIDFILKIFYLPTKTVLLNKLLAFFDWIYNMYTLTTIHTNWLQNPEVFTTFFKLLRLWVLWIVV